MDFTRIETPLAADLTGELSAFWEEIFASSYAGFRNQMVGGENAYNQDIFYLLREEGVLAGTTHLTIARHHRELGGLGEVATPPAFRQRGVATRLCTASRDEFQGQGGQALFLGTGNSDAARVYSRVGYRQIDNANVWLVITGGETPDTFLQQYLAGGRAVTVSQGTVDSRIPMIPLMVSPHPWRVLDANTPMFSTRYALQKSCMGLYPRYERLAQDGRGAWFGATTDQGRLVGLATARLDSAAGCQVDGFTHENYRHAWIELLQSAIAWGMGKDVTKLRATVAQDDTEKAALFESLGFLRTGAGNAFHLDEVEVPSLQMERSLAR
ncbi:MAG: GNAT family N-acetyltransferase [Chloroflexi bacterium]|nr:GNAT family N-acetyltransferase [Chloroflexota bacterium]